MAESSKKKRKTSYKNRNTSPKKAVVEQASQPEQLEEQEVLVEQTTDELVIEPDTLETDDQSLDIAEDQQSHVESESEVFEMVEPATEDASPYDHIITHRTSSQPTADKWTHKLTSGLSTGARSLRTPKPWLWLGGISLTLLLILTIWWQWQRSYVGVVNGQYIPTSELVAYTMSNGASQALPQLTQQYLINQEAYQQNIQIPEDKIQAELQKIIDDSGGQEAYQEALSQYGIPESHLINQIRTKEILVELTKDKVSVSDEEVAEYYETNKETLDPDGSRGFDNIKDLIRTQLTEQKQEAEFSTHLQSLTEKSHVQTNLDHASLSFFDFIKREILSIPGDLANLFNFSSQSN